ncbi:MAG: glutamate-cysteine ligase family protein [Saprospiraceae bacterium]|nr:glutamate-cysteine ligase family protein [Saprospiraceae bacterium]
MPEPKLTLDICRSYIENLLFEPGDVSTQNSIHGTVGSVGVELEVFPYRSDVLSDAGVSPVALYEGEDALIHKLIAASEPYGGVAKYWYPAPHQKSYVPQIDKIEFANGDRFLFEPGGQVEISTAPCQSMDALQEHLESRQHILKRITQLSNIHFAQTGTNPWFGEDQIGNQLHKPRYKALEQYFDTIGPYGRQMMQLTCSLHINFDLGPDETTRIKRIVAANLLVPFVTALFANSPRIAGKTSGHKAYRSYIWQHLDRARTGILPGLSDPDMLSKEDLIGMYLALALKAPLIYIDALGDQALPRDYTMEYWLDHPIQGLWPDRSHFETHVSLLFPEVRLKGYLELRSIDAPPVEWQMVPVCFYAGLLYSDQHLDKMLELLLPLAAHIDELFEASTFGLVLDEVFVTSKKLMVLAIDGFSGLPDSFKGDGHVLLLKKFYEIFTAHRKTFADGNAGTKIL